ncbi:hypothetical protein EIN_390740 [Entamoeba invadens IP1]|uniref:Thioredoxin domain-containing protein n=1 Tax=Entamoeba invadens IP1 TaxID=370355 RepID=A0A0A1U584_ENTIV|nr:hypothetical protein EIN_390740 [Entamoeba invadens IP1]ELP89449.1 hypothetical protein EIN_390740 [Entamoeba invadens IP1]|eukprot:XP_004256220.1 hypothetical protein EIN_390740 [Entamoeba invadens IP1]
MQLVLLVVTLFLCTNGRLQVLNLTNFKEAIDSNELLLIKFVVKECPLCKDYTYEFNQLSMFAQIPFGEISCDEPNDKLCEKEGLSVMPTTILYKKGKQFRKMYGMYEYGQLKDWLRDMLSPVYLFVSTQSEIQRLLNTSFAVAIVSYQSNDQAKQYETMMTEIAEETKRYKQQFVWITNSSVNCPQMSVHVLDDNGDLKVSEFELVYNKSVILFKSILAFVPPFSKAKVVQNSLEQVDVPVLFYYYISAMTGATFMKKIARKYQLILPFVTQQVFEPPKGHNGKDQKVWVSILHDIDVYPMRQNVTEKHVEEFVEDFLQGKIRHARRGRKSTSAFMSKVPPLITLDNFDVYTSQTSAIIVCPFSDRKCIEYIDKVVVPLCTKFNQSNVTNFQFGVVDIEQDEVVNADVLQSYPTLLVYSDDNSPYVYAIKSYSEKEILSVIHEKVTSLDLDVFLQIPKHTNKKTDNIKIDL